MTIAERRIRRKGTRAQFEFALEAKAMLPPCDASLLAASQDGLHLLARDEAGLNARLQDLREGYGPGIEIAPPAARPQAEPAVKARIGLQRRDLPAIRQALLRRGANPSEEYAGIHYCVLRFEAPFSQLLGLPRELAALSGGTATHMFQPVADRSLKRRTDHAYAHRYPDRPRASEPAR